MYLLGKILTWCNHPNPVDERGWLALLHDFGPALLPFLLDEAQLAEIPETDPWLRSFKESVQKHPLSELTPDRGSVWILFAREARLDGLPPCFRADGFLLPFEWVRTAEATSSDRIPQGLAALAEKVKAQFGMQAADFVLQPSRVLGGDNAPGVDLSFGSSEPVPGQTPWAMFESAWGALASGLYLALHPEVPLRDWPFSSIAFDFEWNEPKDVSELEKKFTLAASFHAEEIAVAPTQFAKARDALGKLRRQHPENARLRRLRIFSWDWTGNLEKDIARLVRCNQVSQRRKLVRTVAANILSLLLLGIGCGLYCADWTHEKVAYFADCVDRHGVLEGVGKLDRGQLQGRSQSYRFHYRGYDSLLPWRRRPILREVYCVNSFDHVRNDGRQHASIPAVAAGRRFVYGENGKLAAIHQLRIDGSREAIYRFGGRTGEIVDIFCRGADGRQGTVDSILPSTKRKKNFHGNVGRFRIMRDVDGRMVRREALRDAGGRPATDEHGIHRVDCRFDAVGRVVKVSFYSWNGHKALDENGADEIESAYDEAGNMVEERWIKNGRPVFRVVSEYDRRGNCTKMKKVSLDAAYPVVGWVEQRRAYDNHGEMVRKEQFDASGNAAKGADSYWTRKVQFADGRLVEEEISYFDEKSEPGSVNGVARCVTRYDGNMRVIETVRYGSDGELLNSVAQAAIVRWKYDDEGREIEYSAQRTNDDEWRGPGLRWSVRRRRYVRNQDGGFVRTTSYFRRTGGLLQPAMDAESGAEQESWSFDRNGRLVCVRLFDANTNAVVNYLNWHRTQFSYDQHGFLSEIAYYGTDDNQVLASGFGEYESVASVRFVNDAAGNAREIALFDEAGKTMMGKNGYAILKKNYDAKGRVAEIALQDADGKPTETRDGFNCRTAYCYDDHDRKTMERGYALDGSYAERKFNANGQEVSWARFSAGGESKVDANGVHCVLYKRDAEGREIKRGFLDASGKPTLNEERIAGLLTDYDEHGAVIEEKRLGTQGELVRDKNGVCIVRWHFDEHHRDVGRTFYDVHTNRVANKDGVAGVRKAYDAAGNKTEEYDIGLDGRARPNEYGVCIAHDEYDRNGRSVKRTFYDADRHPVLSTEGIGGWWSKYDAGTGCEIERGFFDKVGRPCLSADGSAGWKEECDSHGKVVKHLRIDLEGKPSVGRDGTAGWRRTYDERGREKEEIYLGSDGKAADGRASLVALGEVSVRRVEYAYGGKGVKIIRTILSKACEGVSCIVLTFNAVGDCVEKRWEDASGRLVELPIGFACMKTTYNDFHEPVCHEYYDKGYLRCCRQGVFKEVIDYDRTRGGLRVKFNCYDENGFQVADRETGAVCCVHEYDQEYRLVRLKMYGVDRKLVCPKGGVAEAEIVRDNLGRITSIVMLDANGKGTANGIARFKITYSSGADGKLLASLEGYDENDKKIASRNGVPYESEGLAWLREFAGRRYRRLGQ